MKLYLLPTLAIVALLFASCSPSPDGADTTPETTPEVAPSLPAAEPAEEQPADMEPFSGAAPAMDIDLDSLALKIDPVCKMSLEEYPTTAVTDFEGKSYGFCSSLCKKKFVADPEKILARVAAAEAGAPAE